MEKELTTFRPVMNPIEMNENKAQRAMEVAGMSEKAVEKARQAAYGELLDNAATKAVVDVILCQLRAKDQKSEQYNPALLLSLHGSLEDMCRRREEVCRLSELPVLQMDVRFRAALAERVQEHTAEYHERYVKNLDRNTRDGEDGCMRVLPSHPLFESLYCNDIPAEMKISIQELARFTEKLARFSLEKPGWRGTGDLTPLITQGLLHLGLTENDWKDILVRAMPDHYVRRMFDHGFDPDDHNLLETINMFERFETADNLIRRPTRISNTAGNRRRQPPNPNRRNNHRQGRRRPFRRQPNFISRPSFPNNRFSRRNSPHQNSHNGFHPNRRFNPNFNRRFGSGDNSNNNRQRRNNGGNFGRNRGRNNNGGGRFNNRRQQEANVLDVLRREGSSESDTSL